MYVVLCQPKQKEVMSISSLLLMITQDMVVRWKSKAIERFKEFRAKVENQLGKHINVIRSDRGGEYLLGNFKDYLI